MAKTHLRTYAGLAEFLDFCESPTDYDGHRSSLSGSREFTGTDSFAEAVDLAFCWTEGAKRVERMSAQITPRDQKARQETFMSEMGPGVLDMGNYAMGHPQPWVVLRDTTDTKMGSGKIVRILVNITASGSVEKSVIERRGGAILALVASLEKSGKRCEVEICEGTKGSNGDRLIYRMPVKRAHEPLNLFTVAFAMAHPAMLRRFIFSAMEHEGAAIRKSFSVGWGYGKPEDLNETEINGALYLKGLKGWEPVWESDKGAEGWVRSQAEAQGVKF